MSITPDLAARATAAIIGTLSTTQVASTRRRTATGAGVPSAPGGVLSARGPAGSGPDATGAQERCPWCDGSGAAAA